MIATSHGEVIQGLTDPPNSGFEQANKYTIMDPAGNHIGFMAEEENSITKMVMRQWARTHRSFRTHVFDKHGVEVLRVCSYPASFVRSCLIEFSSFIGRFRS
jgi:hypothetical protein